MNIHGKAYWAKVLKPVDTYGGEGQEWSIDITPTDESLQEYKDEGYTSGIKPKVNKKGKTHAGEADYIQLKKPTTDRDGGPLQAPIIVDEYGEEWDPSVLIGNGSDVQVIVGVRKGDFKGTPWKKPALQKIMVTNLVPVGEDFDYKTKSSEETEEEVWDT